MLFWFLVAGVLLLVLGASFWFDHKHGRSSSDTDAMDAVRAQRARATEEVRGKWRDGTGRPSDLEEPEDHGKR